MQARLDDERKSGCKTISPWPLVLLQRLLSQTFCHDQFVLVTIAKVIIAITGTFPITCAHCVLRQCTPKRAETTNTFWCVKPISYAFSKGGVNALFKGTRLLSPHLTSTKTTFGYSSAFPVSFAKVLTLRVEFFHGDPDIQGRRVF